MTAADEVLQSGRFVHADCMWVCDRFIAYRLEQQAIVPEPDIVVDGQDLTDVFPLFTEQHGDVTYGGGEAAAHGSCGFFFRRSAAGLDWALMSLDSEPFVGVELERDRARFRSRSGVAWVVDLASPTRVRLLPGLTLTPASSPARTSPAPPRAARRPPAPR